MSRARADRVLASLWPGVPVVSELASKFHHFLTTFSTLTRVGQMMLRSTVVAEHGEGRVYPVTVGNFQDSPDSRFLGLGFVPFDWRESTSQAHPDTQQWRFG